MRIFTHYGTDIPYELSVVETKGRGDQIEISAKIAGDKYLLATYETTEQATAVVNDMIAAYNRSCRDIRYGENQYYIMPSIEQVREALKENESQGAEENDKKAPEKEKSQKNARK